MTHKSPTKFGFQKSEVIRLSIASILFVFQKTPGLDYRWLQLKISIILHRFE